MIIKGISNVDGTTLPEDKLEQTRLEFRQLVLDEEKEIKKYLSYFEKYFPTNAYKIVGSLTSESRSTLKQFLTAHSLSIAQLFEKLRLTEYKAAEKNIRERISKLEKLGLIKKTKPISVPDYPREGFYKLTTFGLFVVLQNIDKKDSFDQIFQLYKDDDFFNLFIFPLIDKETLCSLRDNYILWIFVNYTKQICVEVNRRLEIYLDIKRKGKYEVPGLKWSFNLKNEQKKWTDFCYNLLNIFYGTPLRGSNDLKKKEPLITNPFISDNKASFDFDDRHYILYLDERKKQASLHVDINGKQVKPSICNSNITIKKGRSYFTLYKTKYRDLDEYENHMRMSFFEKPKILKTELGLSILQLYNKKDIDLDLLDEEINNKNNSYRNDVKLLANSSSIKNIVENISNEINDQYEEYIRNRN